MKPISTFTHGILDYAGALALIFAPEIFSFTEIGGAAVTVPRVLGVLVLLQALVTNYELGLVRSLSMKAHLGVDYLAGIFLAASPWIFNFDDAPANAWVPHLVVGLAILALAAATQTIPSFGRNRTATVAGGSTTAAGDLEERRRANAGRR